MRYVTLVSALAVALMVGQEGLCAGPDSAPLIETITYSTTTDNSVQGTITDNTWDPADPLTISGRLWQRESSGCEENYVVASADSVVVLLWPPDCENDCGNGHMLCPGTTYASAPGTDANGYFSVTIRGGGVSFVSDPGGDGYCGGRIELLFKEGSSEVGRVVCSLSEDWPDCSTCDEAPVIYGKLASPDLTGDGNIDGSDLSQLSVYITSPATPISATFGWQADFNHTGGSVDAGDIAYFTGRLGKNCNSSKAGDGDYQMDVRNLLSPVLLAFLEEHSMTAAQVVEIWEANGWTYDREGAEAIAAGRPVPESVPWGAAKALYR